MDMNSEGREVKEDVRSKNIPSELQMYLKFLANMF